MWEQRGVPQRNIVILQPAITDILIPRRFGTFVEEAGQRLRLSLKYPITVHSFSNGGFMLLSALLASSKQCGRGLDLNFKIQKIVLDSAPAPVHPDMMARALISAAFGYEDSQDFLLFTPLRFLCKIYLHLPSIQRKHEEIWNFWQNDAPTQPILSLLSYTDPVIDVDVANAFLDEQVWPSLCLHAKVV